MLNEYSAESLLEQLRELDEHPRLEAKSGSQIGASVMQTVCALANEPSLVGGYILLGVEEPDVSFWVSEMKGNDKLLGVRSINGRKQYSSEKKMMALFTTVGKAVYNLFTTHPLQHHLIDCSLGRKNRLGFMLWRFFHFRLI